MEDLVNELDKLQIQSTESENKPAIQPKKVGVLSDKRTLQHSSAKAHPECPDRVVRIMQNFRQKGLLQNQLISNVDTIAPIDLSLVAAVHGKEYTEFVSEMWPEDEVKRKQIYINVDTYFNKNTIEAAKIAANSGINCVDRVYSGEWRSAFAIIRPPGHHSGMKGQPHGFCFFNNVGIAASYALKKHEAKRILIMDWDAHHGEGTQNLFYDSKEVMYASIHRFDEEMFFPHVKESSSEFIGRDAGKGYNINVAMNVETKQSKAKKLKIKETCGDKDYIYMFERLLLPIFREFNPELIFISAGFDSACGDPLGGLEVSTVGFTYMTQQLMKINPKIIAILEGGYNLESISWASEAVLRAILGNQAKEDVSALEQLLKSYVPNKISLDAVRETLKYVGQYWPVLNSKQLVQLEKTKTKLSEQISANKVQTESIASTKTETTNKTNNPSKIDQSDTKSNSSEINNLAKQFNDLELKSKTPSNISTASQPVKTTTKKEQIVHHTSGIEKGDMKKKTKKAQEAEVKSVTTEYSGPMTRAKTKQLAELAKEGKKQTKE